MARGGAIRKGLTFGLAAGVGAAVLRAARARRAGSAGAAPPVWPPLPTALVEEPPAPPLDEGADTLVAEAAVLEADGITETADVDPEALAMARPDAVVPAPVSEPFDAFWPEVERPAPEVPADAVPAFTPPPPPEPPAVDDAVAMIEPAEAEAEAEAEVDEAEEAEVEAAAEEDLEALVLAEEAALEEERLEAERLELARLAAARERAEEQEELRAAREQEREEALARFAAQREEAQQLLALQQDRAARATADESEAGERLPMMAGDFDVIDVEEIDEVEEVEDDVLEDPRVKAVDLDGDDALDAEDEASADEELEDRMWPLERVEDRDTPATVSEDEELGDTDAVPSIEPVVPDDAVADLDEEPVWGVAVEPGPAAAGRAPAPDPAEDKDEDEDTSLDDDYWPVAGALDLEENEPDEPDQLLIEDDDQPLERDEVEDAASVQDAIAEDAEAFVEDELFPRDELYPRDRYPTTGLLDDELEADADVAGDVADEVRIGDEAIEDEVTAADVPVTAPPADVPAPEQETWSAWVAANPASWAAWQRDAEPEPLGSNAVTAPEPLDAGDEDEPADELDELEEIEDDLEDLDELEDEPAEPSSPRRRPIMTGDFDDATDDLPEGDEDVEAASPPLAAPLRRSGRPRVPLKARRLPTPRVPEDLDDVAQEPEEELPAAPAKATRSARKVPAGKVTAPTKKATTKASPNKAAAKEAAGRKQPPEKVAEPKPKVSTRGRATSVRKSPAPAGTSNDRVPTPAKRASRPKKADVLWVEPIGDTCPSSHPVKASVSRGIFHVVGGLFYERNQPERCYRVAAAAEADGLRQAKR